jgi:release factor glutamine methyltransferase
MSIELAYQQLAQQLETLYEKREASNIANWVIEHITGLKRMDRIIQKNASLTPEQELELTEKTSLLLTAQPVQYVLGEAWFAGNPYFVDASVLIPRPETEELVEWILTDDLIKNFRHFLDIGAGSGCIPITLKLKKPHAFVLSFDISKEALAIAQINATKLNADVHFMEVDILDETRWHNFPIFDCIVSNPPYIKDTERSSMAKHVTEFEPSLALFVRDEDPLVFYRKIALFALDHLEAHGNIYLEINEALGKEVLTLYEGLGYTTELRKDLSGRDRMVKAEKK